MNQIKLEFPYDEYRLFDDGKKHEITINRLRKYICDTIDYYCMIFTDHRSPYTMMFALIEEHNGNFFSIKLDNYAEFLSSLNFYEGEEMDINIIKKDISLAEKFKNFDEYIAYRKYIQQQNVIKMIKSTKNLSKYN